MEPVTAPLEAVDAAGAQRTAQADALVVAAWTDHHGEVYAFLVRTTRDPAVAEDLLSEAYLRLTTEARAGRAPDNVRAWLYRVGANLAVSRGRRISAALRGMRPDPHHRADRDEPGPPRRATWGARDGPACSRSSRTSTLAPGPPCSSRRRASAAPRSPPRSAAPRPRPAPCCAGPGCGSGAGWSRRRRPDDRARTYLQLAAIALDFPLAPSERGRLEAHLAGCPACARRASAYRGDALALGHLPAVVLPERRGAEILAAALHPAAVRNPLRLLVLAALLGLLLLGSLAVGAQLLRNSEEDLSVVVPVPSQSAGPEATPVPTPNLDSPVGTLVVTHGEGGKEWIELVTLKTGAVTRLGRGQRSSLAVRQPDRLHVSHRGRDADRYLRGRPGRAG